MEIYFTLSVILITRQPLYETSTIVEGELLLSIDKNPFDRNGLFRIICLFVIQQTVILSRLTRTAELDKNCQGAGFEPAQTSAPAGLNAPSALDHSANLGLLADMYRGKLSPARQRLE